MAVTPGMANTMKYEALKALSTDTWKIALYTQAAASLNQDTTAYTTTGEVTGAGYTTGGKILAAPSVVVDHALNIAYLHFPTNPVWLNSSITADAAMIYNASKNNACMGLFTFTLATTVVGPFTVQLPAAGSTAIFKIT